MSSVQLHQDSQSPGLFCGIVLPLELRMVQDFGFTLLRNAIIGARDLEGILVATSRWSAERGAASRRTAAQDT